MRVRLTDRDLQEIIYERNLPVNFKDEDGFGERHFSLDHRYGKATFTEQWFDGIHINDGKLTMNENIRIRMESFDPIIEMHFSLSGTSNVSFADTKQQMTFDARRHNIFYMPHFDGFLETGKQKDPNHAFEIHLTEDYFKKILNTECSVLNSFAEKTEKQEMIMLSRHHLYITAQMDAVVKEIIHCKKKGAIRRLFIESKVLELLALQIEQYESTYLKKACTCLKEYDLNKIHHARFLVEKHISNPYSLGELSKLTGLNEFKLKSGFKELFGNTVFGYLHELRMEEAKRLLLDARMPIAEVAEYCGYEYVQHFTTAFKKKHGITPGKYRV